MYSWVLEPLVCPLKTRLLTPHPRHSAAFFARIGTASRTSCSASFKPPPDRKILSKYINIAFAEQVLASNRKKIVARNPQSPPSTLGLLSIIGFTSCGLDRRFKELAGDKVSPTGTRAADELSALHTLAIETRGRIATTQVPEARRNAMLNRESLMQFEIGKIVVVSDLVNVTLASKQVYSGGNVDFVYRPAHGRHDLAVVDVSMLSAFSDQEVEGYLEPCLGYMVEDVQAGKESGSRASPLDLKEYPPVTVVMRPT